MNNLQLATTLAASTGTGKLFTPYLGNANLAVLKESSPSGQASLIAVKRIEARPTSNNGGGVERVEIKLTEYYTVNSIVYPAIYRLSCDIPVPIAVADRLTSGRRLVMLGHMSLWDDACQYAMIPV